MSIIAAALTWAAHSSVATVLLTMSFAAQGVVPPQAAFALVLGANLGTALNPLLEGATGGDPVAKRVPVGNLLNRLVGVVLGLALLNWIGPLAGDDRTRCRARRRRFSHRVQSGHGGAYFCRCCNPSPGCSCGCCRRARHRPIRHGRSISIEAARETPVIALAGAAREALRMADVLEAMLRSALDAIDRGDRKRVRRDKGA